MKFSVGYQLREEDKFPFSEIVNRYQNQIAEVFFAWPGVSSGRDPQSAGTKMSLLKELKAIYGLGIHLDLLLNANCYGGDGMSTKIAGLVGGVLQELTEEGCKPHVVTTASPAVAFMVRQVSPATEVRASVNMRIGTVKGMEYAKHLFDSFYVCRDYNRDLARIRELKQWADENGKKIFLQANSGCMRDCSFQTFHDNLVSHHKEVEDNQNISGFLPYACWNYLRSRENWVSVLQNTWIRPEDVWHYEPYISMMKLATRMHQLPMMVIDAYTKGAYSGNLLDLFEPGFGPAFAPYILDNGKFPKDWFEKSATCSKQCRNCNYCQTVLEKILIEN